jgi:hypothetical protein
MELYKVLIRERQYQGRGGDDVVVSERGDGGSDGVVFDDVAGRGLLHRSYSLIQ